MEELALKPLGSVPTNVNYAQLEQASVVRSVLTYNYGEDISKWGVILPFTLNHTQTNNLLALFDGQGDTYYQLGDTSGASKTTTLIIDFGKPLEVRGVIVSFNIFCETAAVTGVVTTSYSEDMVNYTQISQTTNSAAGTIWADHVSNTTRIRSLKIVVNTSGANLVNRYVQIFQSAVIV